eukprot:tig00000217_g19168.t1
MLIDALTVVGIAALSSILSEFLSWILIYRTDSYNRLTKQIAGLSSKLERRKEATVSVTKQKSAAKRIDKFEEELKNLNREMTMSKMKSNFALAIVMITVFTAMNSVYDAKTVARLPFEPFSLVRGLSHRSLLGSDYRDCSATFIYVLASMSIRQSIQKFFGFQPRAAQANTM